MIYLLDVNVLLALSDPMHTHHKAAHRWFSGKGHTGWATCPIVENGFVRIASHPAYPNRPGDAQAVLQLLRTLCQAGGHTFWPDSESLRFLIPPGSVLSHNQLTDLYLLGLAVANGGKLATFDQGIAAGLVSKGMSSLETLSP